MKRLLCSIGIIALLASALVMVATGPASALTVNVPVDNTGTDDLKFTATSTSAACDTVSITVKPADGIKNLALEDNCNYSVVITDIDAICVVEGSDVGAGGPYLLDGSIIINVDDGGPASPRALWYRETTPCGAGPLDLTIDKDVSLLDDAAGQLTTFAFTIKPSNAACTAAQSFELEGGVGIPTDKSVVTKKVISSYVSGANIKTCKYTITEAAEPLWTFVGWTAPVGTWDALDQTKPKAVVDASASKLGEGSATVVFENKLDHVPMYVDKTYVGRDYYTTVDRSDFHIYTPGLCGNFLFDPFGGLLGNVGLYRTINAVQQTQIVWALPATVVAAVGINGAQPCTYRLQENNMPDGCEAVDPDGENADGPYWDQTWVPGETTAFIFHVVNDCTPPPEPTPTPDTAPTTVPPPPHHKKGAVKGGSASPKFTG